MKKTNKYIDQCGKELYDWLIKWTENDNIEPEVVVGIMESLKHVYLDRAIKVATIKELDKKNKK